MISITTLFSKRKQIKLNKKVKQNIMKILFSQHEIYDNIIMKIIYEEHEEQEFNRE
jgi:hypothetical protein